MSQRLLALAALFIAAVTVVGAHGAEEEVAGFRFDGGFTQRGGLSFTFDRPVDTLDEAANTVGADAPRYANPRLICGALNEVDTVANQTGTNFMFSGHGCDNDSLTPLSAVINKTQQRVQVYRGDDATEVTNLTFTNPTSGIMDMLAGAVPGKTFSPRAIVVCHGMIAVFCETFMLADDGTRPLVRPKQRTRHQPGPWSVLADRVRTPRSLYGRADT